MKILSVDLGLVRTGIAISDIGELLASPVGVLKEVDKEKLADKILNICNEKKVGKIVLGLPKNMDGTEGESAKRSREFKETLERITNIEVVLVDERGTTITAHNYLNMSDTRGKKRKNIIDSVAATIILQNYLDSKKSNKEPIY